MKIVACGLSMLLLIICLAFGQVEEKGFVKGRVLGIKMPLSREPLEPYPIFEAMIAAFEDMAKDGTPVGYISTTVSDNQGNYEVELPGGDYVFVVSKTGYETLIWRKITVIPHAETFNDFHLHENLPTTGNIYKSLLLGVWDLTAFSKEGVVIKPPDAMGKMIFTGDHYSYNIYAKTPQGITGVSTFGSLDITESKVILRQMLEVEVGEEGQKIQHSFSPREIEMSISEKEPGKKFAIGDFTITLSFTGESVLTELILGEKDKVMFTFQKREQISQYSPIFPFEVAK